MSFCFTLNDCLSCCICPSLCALTSRDQVVWMWFGAVKSGGVAAWEVIGDRSKDQRQPLAWTTAATSADEGKARRGSTKSTHWRLVCAHVQSRISFKTKPIFLRRSGLDGLYLGLLTEGETRWWSHCCFSFKWDELTGQNHSWAGIQVSGSKRAAWRRPRLASGERIWDKPSVHPSTFQWMKPQMWAKS